MTWPQHIVLPWPARGLSPNARHGHWAPRAKLAKAAREHAWGLALSLGLGKACKDAKRVPVRLIFNPPDKRRRDRDNLLASMKPTLDGLADALSCDDAAFIPTIEMGEPTQGGAVCVTIGRPESVT